MLKNPPEIKYDLFVITLILDILAIITGLFISLNFSILVTIFIAKFRHFFVYEHILPHSDISMVNTGHFSVIASIGTALPAYRFKQSEVLEFMTSQYASEHSARKLGILSRQSGIEFRHSVIPDFNIRCITPQLFADKIILAGSILFHQLFSLINIRIPF